jgi:hypothetical protein
VGGRVGLPKPDMGSGNEFLWMDSLHTVAVAAEFSLFCEIANFGSVEESNVDVFDLTSDIKL